MNDPPKKPDAKSGPARERIGSLLRFAWLLALFVLFFGILLGGLFELFRFVDLLLQEWEWGWSVVGRAGLMFVIGVVAIRVSWWLALAILGLVTRKYDLVGFLDSTILLDRTEYAAFYDRVDEICRQVRAPHPDQIRLNPWPQCYVIEQRSFSLATQRRLTLVVGLPQMLVFTTCELRVVLTHEMAHFGNRDTTLTVFLFRFVESLRLALAQLRQHWWHRVDPLYWFFAAFYATLHRVAVPVQRRLELHADRTSAALCGGELAAHTLLKNWFLDGQFEEAVEIWTAQSHAAPARVNINVFQLFADRWRELSPDAEQYLAERLAQEPLLADSDTHPTTHARLALLREYPAVELHDGKPALALLPNHQALQRQAAEMLNAES